MNNKINLGILFGGRSCEHEVSVISARSIVNALDSARYNITLIGIDKQGYWRITDELDKITESGSIKSLGSVEQGNLPQDGHVSLGLHDNGNLITSQTSAVMPPKLDVVFPVLHGTFGEDGTLQGVLEMAGMPYVGCGVASSALAMDKALAKKVFQSEGLPQAPYITSIVHEWGANSETVLDRLEKNLSYPVFVKPANMGSSVGIKKAQNRQQAVEAIDHALKFDTKVVIEQSMENCREIECAILGNAFPDASVLGEIIPGAEFYNYETKYLDNKSQLVIPADIDQTTSHTMKEMAIAAFKAIDGSGLSRVDFFLDKRDNAIYLNEVNTMPGFTPISMYPQLWAKTGIEYPELIHRLITLGIERHKINRTLTRAFQ